MTAVDYFDGRGTPNERDTLPEFLANLSRYGIDGKVTTHHPDLPLEGEFDFVFIDGAHDRDSVTADIAKALDVLSPGGLIAFHDYGTTDPGVITAVNEFIERGAKLLSRHESLAVVRPPAAIPMEV